MGGVRLIVLLTLFLNISTIFALSPPSTTNKSSGNIGDDDSYLMKSLSNRIRKANQLPLIFRETLLPRQVLKITIKHGLFFDLIRKRIEDETPYFGMLGIQQSGEPMARGVEVTLLGWEVNPWKTGIRLQLKARRRLEIADYLEENRDGGWYQATIKYQDSSDDETDIRLEEARQQAKELTELSKKWIQLARKHERFDDQIDLLLQDLGQIPSWHDAPSECAFWVGALINPTPKIHLAYEMRQKLLNAETAHERTCVALKAMKTSMQRMDPLFRESVGATESSTTTNDQQTEESFE